MPRLSYTAPEVEDLGSMAAITAALDDSPRTDFNENGNNVDEGNGSRDICDPNSPNPGPGTCD